MNNKNSVFVIDLGNTHAKLAFFVDGEPTYLQRFEPPYYDKIKAFMANETIYDVVVSSVLNQKDTAKITALFKKVVLVDHTIKLPISIDYQTPNSLGIDRICNAVAISLQSTTTAAVCIDFGTCIKFDVVVDKSFVGGSISPGIGLRYKALNDYTANLPLLDVKKSCELIGDGTIASIQSGVMNGIQSEVYNMMQRYEQHFKELTFFFTGGDYRYFDFPIKNNIFVDENLTLRGLYQIYLFHAN